MKGLISFLIFAVFNISLIRCQQSTATKCQSQFLTNLYSCMQADGINPTNLFWFTRNGTMGNKPENETEFKIKACNVETNLYACSNKYVEKLKTDESCPDVEKEAIKQFFYSMFISYDEICAHPCRETLLANLKKCYAKNGVNPDLFLSDATVERGAILGQTEMQVQQFCGKRNEMVGCLRVERDNCPEAPILLSRIGLDIESLKTTVDVLCAHPKVYLNSTDCFSHPEPRIAECRNTQSRDILDLNLKAKNENLQFQPYIEQYCKIRIDHVDCDLRGWAAAKRSSCADDSVMGLRIELECSLLPDYCVKNYTREVDVLCHIDKFKREDRDPNKKKSDDNDDDNAGSSVETSIFLLAVYTLVSFIVY